MRMRVETKKDEENEEDEKDEEEEEVSTRRRTRKRECSSYGLSTTKHPLNNSVINSPGRLRRPVPPLARPLLSSYAPEVPRRLQEDRSLRLSQRFPSIPFLFSVFVPISLSSRSTPLPLTTFLHSLANIHPTCIFFSLFHLSPLSAVILSYSH